MEWGNSALKTRRYLQLAGTPPYEITMVAVSVSTTNCHTPGAHPIDERLKHSLLLSLFIWKQRPSSEGKRILCRGVNSQDKICSAMERTRLSTAVTSRVSWSPDPSISWRTCKENMNTRRRLLCWNNGSWHKLQHAKQDKKLRSEYFGLQQFLQHKYGTFKIKIWFQIL